MKKMESNCEMGDERDEDAEQYVRFRFGCVRVRGEKKKESRDKKERS